MASSKEAVESLLESTNSLQQPVQVQVYSSLSIIVQDKNESESQVLEEFRLFPKLPLELRDIIWKLELPGPRIVRVIADLQWKKDINNTYTPNAYFWKRISYLGPTRPEDLDTPLLQVNRESRDISLKILPFCLPSPRGGVEVRFGPQDALEISSLCHLSEILSLRAERGLQKPSYLGNISCLAFSRGDMWECYLRLYHLLNSGIIWDPLKNLEGLQKIVWVVLDEEVCDKWEYPLAGFQNNLTETGANSAKPMCLREADYQIAKFQRKAAAWKVDHPDFKIPQIEWPVKL